MTYLIKLAGKNILVLCRLFIVASGFEFRDIHSNKVYSDKDVDNWKVLKFDK